MFARISPRYDLLNRLLSLGIDQRWRGRVVSAISGGGEVSPSGDRQRRRRILDLCCGTGDLALQLAARGHDVTGVDFCHEMLHIGRGRSSPRVSAAPRLVEADALALPFSDESYDGATVAFGVRNLENLDRGLAEAARVLRSGGTLAVLEFGRPEGRFLASLYGIYLGRIVPFVGRLVAGAPAAYGYLSSSIQSFEDQTTFPARLERAGFTSVRCVNLTGGIAALYTARKP